MILASFFSMASFKSGAVPEIATRPAATCSSATSNPAPAGTRTATDLMKKSMSAGAPCGNHGAGVVGYGVVVGGSVGAGVVVPSIYSSIFSRCASKGGVGVVVGGGVVPSTIGGVGGNSGGSPITSAPSSGKSGTLGTAGAAAGGAGGSGGGGGGAGNGGAGSIAHPTSGGGVA